MNGARRLVAALLAVALLCAAVVVSSHGHLAARDHDRGCATCTLAEARSLTAAPVDPLPAPPLPLLVAASPAGSDEAVPVRPPLDTAPKHGPPART